jgi:hypothetical protein
MEILQGIRMDRKRTVSSLRMGLEYWVLHASIISTGSTLPPSVCTALAGLRRPERDQPLPVFWMLCWMRATVSSMPKGLTRSVNIRLGIIIQPPRAMTTTPAMKPSSTLIIASPRLLQVLGGRGPGRINPRHDSGFGLQAQTTPPMGSFRGRHHQGGMPTGWRRE